jgi:chloramphenicol 3-O-phosphotransferase
VRLFFLYGPPAVGKLTVAKKLSELTGFKLHHNHLSVDFVKSIFDFGTPTFQRLVDKYRRDILGTAAKEGVNTIFTYVYNKGMDDDFVHAVKKRVLLSNGTFCPVRLYCNRKELLRRISSQSRKKMGKLTSRSELDRWFVRYRLNYDIPGERSLKIDTSKVESREAARKIAKYYKVEIMSKLGVKSTTPP